VPLVTARLQRADLVDQLTNARVAQAAGQVAGKFKVIRAEIGGVEMPLRDILLGSLPYVAVLAAGIVLHQPDSRAKEAGGAVRGGIGKRHSQVDRVNVVQV
jgi:hypothetical protein